MLENFLEEVRFFLPSPELTKSLFAAVAAVRLSDQIRAREDRDQTQDVGDDYLQNLPPDEPAEASLNSPLPLVSEEEEILFQRRFIAEELYHHLAFLSRSPMSKRGLSLPIRESVVRDMSNVLGLPQEERLLLRLADEFTSWLSELGQFTAGWGNIILAHGNQIYLEELHPAESNVVAPPKRVFIPRASVSGERSGRRRVRGGGQDGKESD
jgi:hypothetical protein